MLRLTTLKIGECRAPAFCAGLPGLRADRVAPDGRVDAMLLTLLPGESATIRVTTAADVPREAFLDPLVLRSANQLLDAAPEPA